MFISIFLIKIFEIFFNKKKLRPLQVRSHDLRIAWIEPQLTCFRSSTAFSTFSLVSIRVIRRLKIASMVGYENAFYFSRLFKKQKGLSPAAYRKIFREKYTDNL